MASWGDLREHLRARYELAADQAGWVGMVWTFTFKDLALAQRVKVEHALSAAGEWVRVLAAVCRADRIDAAGALRFNARLNVGALVVDGDMCYLRAVLPLDTLTLRDLDRAIELVARETARLRDPKAGGGEAALFTPYED